MDFGQCVRELSAYSSPAKDAGQPRQVAIARALGELATPPLLEHFARFLQRDGCGRTGPDDCVLALNAWAALRAADPALARALRSLEVQVAPDALLAAALQAPAGAAGGAEDIASLNAGLRIGGFLQAKLRSVLALPQAWPADALARTFAQMTQLRAQMAPAYSNFRGAWRLEENRTGHPWLALVGATTRPAVADAMLAELARIGPDPDCSLHAIWFDYGGPALQARFVQQQKRAGQSVPCGDPAAARANGGSPAGQTRR